MEKVRILGIAPYSGLQIKMSEIASRRDDIELNVYVGDLAQGAEIVRRTQDFQYDIIISRGGTAELIRQETNKPIVEISLSVYDILRALKLSENYSGRHMIVGFPSITNVAHLLCDLLHYDIEITTIHSTEESENVIKSLKEKGYRMIICDMVTHTLAQQNGLNAILITSGEESIESAFDQAVRIYQSCASTHTQNRLLTLLLNENQVSSTIYDDSGNLIFTSLEHEDYEALLQYYRRELPYIIKNGSRNVIKRANNKFFSISCKKVLFEEKTYVAYYLLAEIPPALADNHGIKYLNKTEAQELLLNSMTVISTPNYDLQYMLEQYGKTASPILILGENGTEKDKMANTIYLQSELQNNPVICIDCAMLNDKHWSYLTSNSSSNSPLFSNSNTIYFRNIDCLADRLHNQLFSIIEGTSLCKRNKVMFSFTIQNENYKSSPVYQYLTNSLYCLTLRVPSLREQADEIPNLASLYLNSLNVKLAKQIIGFEPDGLRMLQEFHWPDNHAQFERILTTLVTTTATPYISTSTLKVLLADEIPHKPAYMASGTESSFALDLNQPLDQITKQIIEEVIQEENGNQSKAAKRLGISRTTLWRMLK